MKRADFRGEGKVTSSWKEGKESDSGEIEGALKKIRRQSSVRPTKWTWQKGEKQESAVTGRAKVNERQGKEKGS